MSEVRIIAEKSKAAVIGIFETWLDNSVNDAEINIEGYTVIRNDRNRKGGGVCIYINNKFAFSKQDLKNSENIESVWAEIYLPKTKPFTVGVVYRPPNDLKFLYNFEESLKCLRSDLDNIILGDFNICMKNKKDQLYEGYKDILNLYDLTQLISNATRVTENTSTLIDHILVNNNDKFVQSGTITLGLSDHNLIYCTRKISKGQINDHNTVKIRSTKNFDSTMFVEELEKVDWSCCTLSDCVETNWNVFRDVFLKIINQFAPIKEIRLKQRTEPWMDHDILELIKERDRLLNIFRKSKNVEDHKNFSKVRNLLQRKIKKAKTEHISTKLEENKEDPKKLWQQLKSLGYRNQKKEEKKVVLNIDDNICHDEYQIANHFNTFFTSVASKLVDALPTAKGTYSVMSMCFRNFYLQRNVSRNQLVLQEVSEQFIYEELCGLNVTKSTGLDEISAKVLKLGASVIKVPVTSIINQSIRSGIVPNSMKQARVKPLFKKGSPLQVGNYRPVSILSVVSKILEKKYILSIERFFTI